MKINTTPIVRNSSIIETISIETYIDYVKNGLDLENLLEIRRKGKGTIEYTKFKENRRATTFNFLFNKKRRNENIICSTGLLYYDIDIPEFDINKIDLSKIYICHKSFGGNGWTLLVKVSNISFSSHNEFKVAYENIAEQIGLYDYFDRGACKMTQPNAISYDPNIIINNSAPIFISNNKLTEKRDTTPIKREKKEEKRICSSVPFLKKEDNFIKLKFNTLLEEYTEDCVYIKEGKEYVECKAPFDCNGKPRKIKNGEKHIWLSIYVNNLIYLNPLANKKELYVMIKIFSDTHCAEEVSEGNLKSIIDYKLKKEAEGNLKPFGATLKRFWVNPSVEDKKAAYNKKRASLGIDAIDAFFGDEICNLNIKVTYKIIADMIGVSEKTIKRRITEEQKQIIKEFNINLKKGVK